MVIRPRLYEADPEGMRVALDRVLGPIGVRRVAATVTGIDTAPAGHGARPGRRGAGPRLRPAGARRRQPRAAAARRRRGAPVRRRHDAGRRRPGLAHRPAAGRPGGDGRFTAVVVGAGFTGIEVATELSDRLRAVAGGRTRAGRARRARRTSSARSSARVRGPEILAALEHAGVEVRLGVRAASRSTRAGRALRRHRDPDPHDGLDRGHARQHAHRADPRLAGRYRPARRRRALPGGRGRRGLRRRRHRRRGRRERPRR